MQRLTKGLVLALLLVILAGIGNYCHASSAEVIDPLKVSLEPSGALQKGAPITMNLTFVPAPEYIRHAGDTGSVSISTVSLSDPGKTLTKNSWPVRFDDSYSYSTTFEINIPDNDLIQLNVQMVCGKLHFSVRRYFITTGETVKYSRTQVPKLPNPRSTKPLRDTLTYEQLQTEYEVILDFRGPSSKENIEGIVGPIPDSCLIDRVRGHYKIKITLENLIKLSDELPNEKVGLKFVTPPPWSRKYNSSEDSLPQLPQNR